MMIIYWRLNNFIEDLYRMTRKKISEYLRQNICVTCVFYVKVTDIDWSSPNLSIRINKCQAIL